MGQAEPKRKLVVDGGPCREASGGKQSQSCLGWKDSLKII